ncbi:hypothetical protein IC611_21245 [Proteus mirabilis]
MPKNPKAWSSRIRTAGVSSFGIGGTNCHIIVQSLPDSLVSIKPEQEVDNNFEYSLLLSAATKESLKKLAGDYAPLIKLPQQTFWLIMHCSKDNSTYHGAYLSLNK